jgi:predicted GTPase
LLTIENFKNCKKYSWSCCGSSTKDPNHICFNREGCYFFTKNSLSTEKILDKVKEVHRAASKVTNLSGEQDRLLSKPIDIFCFGRAGVGKTTLLEALTGRKLGSTSRVDHGTSKLECCDIHDNLPNKEGNSVKIHIRFWDSKGVEKWTGGDLVELFEELKNQNVSHLFLVSLLTC